MAKTIYLIRHAQAQHNVNLEYHIPDAKLTKVGRGQATDLYNNYPHLETSSSGPEVVFTSPLTRTIETSLLGFRAKATQSSLDIIPIAELQENSAMPCDTGSALPVIRDRFPNLDFSRVTEDWNSKTGPWEDSQSALSARAQKVRDLLAARQEDRIAIVTHGGFCSHLIGTYTRFNNAECRTFKLVKGDQGRWVFKAATEKDLRVMRQHVEDERENEEVTFAETEMPTKI